MFCSEERKTDPDEWCDLHELPSRLCGEVHICPRPDPEDGWVVEWQGGRGMSAILNTLMADVRVPEVGLLFYIFYIFI